MKNMRVRSFTMSKLGNKPQDCEDYFAWNASRMKFAMADGASTSIFSDIWARELTRVSVDAEESIMDGIDSPAEGIIRSARIAWYKSIQWATLPWFLRNKAVSGSYSTLLLLQIAPLASSFRYSAYAVGDTCLFMIRRKKITGSFPLSSPEQFGISPKLVWSGKGSPLPGDIRVQVPKFQSQAGIIEPGEILLLATDALSRWLLETGRIDDLLHRIDHPHEMNKFLAGEINSKRMRNDDVALATIEII